jgi:hypothetical protein
MKTFRVTETSSVQFRAEIFNVANQRSSRCRLRMSVRELRPHTPGRTASADAVRAETDVLNIGRVIGFLYCQAPAYSVTLNAQRSYADPC